MVLKMKLNKINILLVSGLLVGALLSGCAKDKDVSSIYKNYSAAQILALGEKSLQKHNYSDAAKQFEAIDTLYPFSPEAEQGDLNAIYANYKNDEIDGALAAVDRYIHLYPRSAHADYAYYMRGLINFDRGKNWTERLYTRDIDQKDLDFIRQSFVDFNDLIKLFPTSIYAKDAQLRMIYIRDIVAKYELSVAQFYFDRKAYVASANRANNIVKHYEGSPQVYDALKLMIKSYQALGATEQANEAQRILRVNYPQAKV